MNSVARPRGPCLTNKRGLVSTPATGLLLLTLLSLLVTPGRSAHAEADTGERPLRLGLLPHLSAHLLVKTYRPLTTYLERRLGRPVVARTAPDFRTYVERVGQGRYDLYLTAPHLAPYHRDRHGHRPLTRFGRELHGVFVVARKAPYRSVAELRGKDVATPDRLSVNALLADEALLAAGLAPHRDVTIHNVPTHNAALLSVAAGRFDAVVVGVSAYALMAPETKNKLRVLAKTRSIPHMFFLANGSLPPREVRSFKQALLEFSADGAGRDFFSNGVFGDMLPATAADLSRLTPMLPLLEAKLQ